uniref:Uncharacterized protein n=1 Tax=Chlamydomonas leiostraca TaxID=1034604 RepID=A0A7S0R7J2_9CHLO
MIPHMPAAHMKCGLYFCATLAMLIEDRGLLDCITRVVEPVFAVMLTPAHLTTLIITLLGDRTRDATADAAGVAAGLRLVPPAQLAGARGDAAALAAVRGQWRLAGWITSCAVEI